MVSVFFFFVAFASHKGERKELKEENEKKKKKLDQSYAATHSASRTLSSFDFGTGLVRVGILPTHARQSSRDEDLARHVQDYHHADCCKLITDDDTRHLPISE